MRTINFGKLPIQWRGLPLAALLCAAAAPGLGIAFRSRKADPKRVAYLRTAIEKQMKTYEKNQDSSRHWALAYQLLSSFLAGATTVILGIKSSIAPNWEWWLSTTALITSALAALITGWMVFFDNRWLWVLHANAANDLRVLLEELNYATSSVIPPNNAKIDRIQREFTIIVHSLNREWAQKRGITPGRHSAGSPREG